MGILSGIRVIEWGALQITPMAGCLLADLGADVIKIEHPVTGDYLRGLQAIGGVSIFDEHGRNVAFNMFNRNKRSMLLDVHTAAGREVLTKLLDNADVFLCGFRQKVALRVELDAASVTVRHPRLVYVQISAFGPRGPDAELPGVDLAGLARAGVLFSQGKFEENLSAAFGVGDQATSIFAAFAAVGGLLHRERTGKGQVAATSMLGALTSLYTTRIAVKLGNGLDLPPVKRRDAYNPLYNVYKGSDGGWFCLSLAFQSDRDWPRLCEALGRTDLAADSRFDSFETRRKNRKRLIGVLDEVFATRPRAYWTKRLAEYDICAAAVNTMDEVVSDPQFLANNYIRDDPFNPGHRMIGHPVDFAGGPGQLYRPAPEFGEHTEEVLLEVCGYSWDEIGELMANGMAG